MNWQSLTDHIQQLELDDCPITHSIFGTTAPERISTAFAQFARTSLQSDIESCSFAYVSVGATVVVRLRNAQVVVFKAYGIEHGLLALQPPALCSSFQIQAKLAKVGFSCPAILVAPQIQDGTLFVAQSYCDPGETTAPFNPQVRQRMAVKLAELIHHTCSWDAPLDLAPWMPWLDGETVKPLWPTPHNTLFDFEKTAAGAEWIDEIATRAQRLLLDIKLPWIIGHADWSLQNMAFQRGQITSAFDWDSLCVGPEAFFVGGAARCYAHDWRIGPPARTITVADAEAFIREYETARGWQFTAEEQIAIGAAMVYTLAYGTRCAHAVGAKSDWAQQCKLQLQQFCDRYLE
ncbi:MAG: phosphotransferase [Thainema sp.]